MTYRAGCATTTATRTESLLAAGALLFLASAAATVHWSRSMAGGMAMPGGWTLAMAWKARQLAVCRACGAPASPAAATTLMHGVRFGVNCSLCCLGLMAVLLLGGMMNIAVVAAVAVAVALERLGPRPALLARATGAVVMATGAVVLARAL